jgi:hypothetical protein
MLAHRDLHLFIKVIMKTNETFKLSKSSKRALAVLSTEKRGHWRKMLIQAEVAEKNAKLAKVREPKGE